MGASTSALPSKGWVSNLPNRFLSRRMGIEWFTARQVGGDVCLFRDIGSTDLAKVESPLPCPYHTLKNGAREQSFVSWGWIASTIWMPSEKPNPPPQQPPNLFITWSKGQLGQSVKVVMLKIEKDVTGVQSQKEVKDSKIAVTLVQFRVGYLLPQRNIYIMFLCSVTCFLPSCIIDQQFIDWRFMVRRFHLRKIGKNIVHIRFKIC
ncbi:hypothetical protein LXL04_012446 [Taraxacum kok-saghyz]